MPVNAHQEIVAGGARSNDLRRDSGDHLRALVGDPDRIEALHSSCELHPLGGVSDIGQHSGVEDDQRGVYRRLGRELRKINAEVSLDHPRWVGSRDLASGPE